MDIQVKVNDLVTAGDHGYESVVAGVKLGLEIACNIVKAHKCEEFRTGECTCIHDGQAAADVIKFKTKGFTDGIQTKNT